MAAPTVMTAPPGPTTITYDRPHPTLTVTAVKKSEATYRVRRDDSLSKIAKRMYHNPNKWPLIWRRNHIRNPNLIRTGMVLRIPRNHPVTAHLMAMAMAAIPKPPPLPPIAIATTIPTQQAAQQSAPVQTDATYSGGSGFEACVIRTESGGNAQVMNATGHYGLYQFSSATWAANGGNPADFGHASVAEQRAVFQNTMATGGGASNWAPYDGC